MTEMLGYIILQTCCIYQEICGYSNQLFHRMTISQLLRFYIKDFERLLWFIKWHVYYATIFLKPF